ncbi:MAG: hypothetical protein U0133_02355 [Gemmatimonadales bacterium]
MRSRLRFLLGLLAGGLFTTNSVAPGLLHQCGAEAAAQAAVSGPHAAHHQMDMGDMAGMPGMSHGSGGGQSAPADGHSLPQGDCHCVGHSCCSVLAAAPPVALAIASSVIAVPVASPASQAVAPLTRPAFLLPQAQAPPVA